MIKLETHCHSLGGSGCADTAPEVIAEEYFKAGYGGIVLTNHYAGGPFESYPGENKKQKLDFYFSLVQKFRDCCAKYGIKVFYGAETRAVRKTGYSEYMLFGFEEKFLYDNKPLFEYTQEEMFRIADKNGVFMYQTHPFREGVNVGDPNYLHGVETFNGHFHHVNNNHLALELCEKHGLIKTSGTDYHHFGQPITAGLYVPENINTNSALADYIVSGKAQMIMEEEKYLTALKKYKGEE